MATHRSITLGEMLGLVRELKKITLREAERLTGISNPMISNYETGRSEPSFRNAVALCDAHNLKLERLANTVRPLERVAKGGKV
jgi:transcriptional regulator with XRE-family HTH domain